MTALAALETAALVRLGRAVNRTLVLPVLFVAPTSRCNSRCVSCDWWRSTGADDLTMAEIEAVAAAIGPLGVRRVAFTGGEPLVRPDVFAIARRFHAEGAKLWLLTSGLQLARFAAEVACWFDRVTVSLDATTPALYRRIRGVDGLAAIESGVARLRSLAPDVRVTARATLHRLNYRELPSLIELAQRLDLDGLSFLAADVSSTAFGRAAPPIDGGGLGLRPDEVDELRAIIDDAARDHAGAFRAHLVAESPARLHRLADYYAALDQKGDFPPVSCNAPWVSAVVEANGTVRPCFFHRAVGSIRERPLSEIVSNAMADFRKHLDVTTDATCRRCVCPMNLGLRSDVW